MRWRDVELPGKVGGTTEGLLVEEVAPASDGLADGQAGRGHVEPAEHGQSPQVREPGAHQRAHDEPAVDGEPALPDRDDLRGIAAVVVPVEDDLVETCPHQTGQDRPLPGADDVISGQPFSLRLPMTEPESDHDGAGHEDAVPANDERTDLESNRSG